MLLAGLVLRVLLVVFSRGIVLLGTGIILGFKLRGGGFREKSFSLDFKSSNNYS